MVVAACTTPDPPESGADAPTTTTEAVLVPTNPGTASQEPAPLADEIAKAVAGRPGAEDAGDLIAGIATDVVAFAEGRSTGLAVTVRDASWYDWYFDCMRSLAVPFEAFETGRGVAVTVRPVEGADLRNAAAAAGCRTYLEWSGQASPAAAPSSEKYLRELYDRQVAAAKCLAEEGYPVEAAPSFERFVESRGTWDAHGAVGGEQVFGGIDIRDVSDEFLESLPSEISVPLAALRDCPIVLVGIPLGSSSGG